ncbi:hypothetical protein NUU61_007116 [Penicillium alfredii]|uniref:RNase MRP protein 1 RNA binding domain-containing protein n=1 Tax=Penicillium alfredii TaxID=1506179 RepID=A0A9W9F2D6_9EURO|nr:uncharacterized protein NUU61_007116 [Penicillium alfredii]KAJ5092246.1 hypothetical protein NUU61_007116 [Penicillium alfredii]
MDSKEILAVHSTLHLIFHRNKNQHQRTKWWKWLSALKRITLKLANALDDRAFDATAAHAYKQHLATSLIPRCFQAFSTVVADNQFSTLGVVLLAALARLTKATRIAHERKSQPRAKPLPKGPPAVASAKEDLGERVSRSGDSRMDIAELTEASSQSTKKTQKAKTKKRKKNAIDDLFNGLL